MTWWNPGWQENHSDEGFDTKRALWDPAGAAARDRGGIFGLGSGPKPDTTASDTFAQLTREQYQSYVQNIMPLENRLIDYANSPGEVTSAVDRARASVNGSFDRQAGAQAERLRGLGIALNPEEQAASDRSTNLSHGLAEVDAINNTTQQVRARQRSILGSPAPQVASMMGGR